MNDTAAANLVKTTFENPYSKERFLIFTKNLFHFFEPKTFVYRGKYIPDAYKIHIKTLERLGKYEDQDNNKIDILAVCLKKPSSLERARTMQRNFIAWYLNGSRGNVAKDAALVAFYAKDSNDWRLSLVKMDYLLAKSKAGKIKAITELTPARRFSFSVGKDENTHTAQRQLLPVLQKNDHPPRLTDLENAFSVEVVTKDFFEKYKTLFLNTEEALDKIVAKDAKIKSDFTEKNIDTVDFTKKLLGQIVFLYFLQKKGWFGVARDGDWRTGPKNFLRRLFEKKLSDYDNFFNDILEPLFYEALAIERPDDFYSKFNCKIPFLNGGLFDPLGNYDWIHTDILLDDNLFSNSTKTKEGDIGDGILDVFDRYNFTVKEDEPLEREVAVDPEMLGKVFENLLEVKDRKSKGTYYTPREIVHYMCQESLVNYLITETDGKVKRDDIETLIHLGETAVEHDSRVVAHGEEKGRYTFKLPQSIRDNASLIDESLEKIKACDPAVGSGAFLVGMMTEVIRARNTLSSYLPKNNRSIYAFKRHAIQNCLYGVDIDPGAVEIAKLRLWLSLIVDEQDIKQIKPLPNLDYKIMQGNSLLEEYEGIKLFDEGIVSTSPFDNTKQIEQVKVKLSELQTEFFKLHSSGELKGSRKQQIETELKRQNDLLKKLTKTKSAKSENDSLFDQFSQAKKKADELKKLHQEFFEAAHKNRKDEIKKQIEVLEWDLIETTLREQNKLSLLPEIERFKKANIKPFFLWHLHFSDVLDEKDGFDVVIANPPYNELRDLDKASQEVYKKSPFYEYAKGGRTNLFQFFYPLAISITKEHGVTTLITQNSILAENSTLSNREYIIENTKILKFVSFPERDNPKKRVFESAKMSVCIGILQKMDSVSQNYNFDIVVWYDKYFNEGHKLTLKLSDISNLFPDKLIFPLSTQKSFNLMKKIKNKKDVLYVNSKSGEVDMTRYKNRFNALGVGYRVLTGAQVLRYKISDNPSQGKVLYLDIDLSLFPKSKREDIKKERIVMQRITGVDSKIRLIMTKVPRKVLCANSTNYIPKQTENDLRYILAILNSSLINWLFKQTSTNTNITTSEINNIPIPNISKLKQGKLSKLVDQILEIAKKDNYVEDTKKASLVKKFDDQIDQIVYKLYGLTPEEIKIVEGGQDVS